MTEQEIQQTVARAQRGDHAAFGVLYDHFVQQLYRYVYFRVKADEAEDLTEMVFVRAWEKLAQYKLTSGSGFGSWLFRIAHNLVVDHYRLNKSIEVLTEEYQEYRAEFHPKLVTEQKMDADVLHKGLAALKDDYQQVLVLRYINGLTNQEISVVMKKSEAALRVLQHRALKALKQVLQDFGM